MNDRDEFAREAMWRLFDNGSPEWVATNAYIYADAMLAERARRDKTATTTPPGAVSNDGEAATSGKRALELLKQVDEMINGGGWPMDADLRKDIYEFIYGGKITPAQSA